MSDALHRSPTFVSNEEGGSVMRSFASALAIVPALIVAAPATPRAASPEEEVEAALRTWAELFAERGESAAERIAALYSTRRAVLGCRVAAPDRRA
jgi:hypothetical protein